MKQKHKIAYMKSAYVFAECSDSKRLKVGAVIVRDNNVLSVGYNGLPVSISGSLEDDQGNTRPEVRHAEMNALYRLITRSETSVGASLFVTHMPCKMCAILIVDTGIKEVYYVEEYRCTEGLDHLVSNGVNVIRIDKQELFNK